MWREILALIGIAAGLVFIVFIVGCCRMAKEKPLNKE